MTIENDGHYSTVEIEDLLAALQEASIVKICRAYNLLGSEARSGYAAADIFGMVVTESLSGTRVWPRGVNLEAYFHQQGRSIIDREGKKYQRHSLLESHDELLISPEIPSSAFAQLSHESPESSIEQHQALSFLREWTNRVFELFSDDAQALCYLNQLLAEKTKKSVVIEICNLTETLYNNVRKRIKDKVRKRFPKGIAWWEVEQ